MVTTIKHKHYFLKLLASEIIILALFSPQMIHSLGKWPYLPVQEKFIFQQILEQPLSPFCDPIMLLLWYAQNKLISVFLNFSPFWCCVCRLRTIYCIILSPDLYKFNDYFAKQLNMHFIKILHTKIIGTQYKSLFFFFFFEESEGMSLRITKWTFNYIKTLKRHNATLSVVAASLINN